ncbi:hypothetical protein niasHT_016973 [Heterodera trifolii]|uniref:Uncharacterized protein n=1 Tax=Heterodera trifolii TaxID=157864 RepID=A0ABD2LAC9_9BILA
MALANIFHFNLLLFFIVLAKLSSHASPSVDFDDEEERNFFRIGKNGTDRRRAAALKKCVPGAECVKHSDCARKEGPPPRQLLLISGAAANARHFCKGIRVGKCDCTVCKMHRRCKNDRSCGGLIGSCRPSGHCDCYNAARKLYAADHLRGHTAKIAAYTQLCYMDTCENSDDCFGLPCMKGECVCATS